MFRILARQHLVVYFINLFKIIVKIIFLFIFEGDKPLRITGEPEKVAKAKEAVMALINPPNRFGTNEYGSKTGSSTNETYIKVPGDKAGNYLKINVLNMKSVFKLNNCRDSYWKR